MVSSVAASPQESTLNPVTLTLVDESPKTVHSSHRHWLVECRLCGLDARRTFPLESTDELGARQAADAYASGHPTSTSHRAALEAYQGRVGDWVTQEEACAAGLLETSEHELRLIAARRAAASVETPQSDA
jgi:hypothetical protein